MNHPLIGQTCAYKDGDRKVECKIVAAKAGPMMLDRSSKIGSARVTATIKLQLQPLDGGQKIWTAPMPNDTSLSEDTNER